MQSVLGILCFILIITVLIVVHEGAHTLTARLFGVRVIEFFVGLPFGPRKTWQSKKTGTTYGVSLVLLGGLTKIAGMSTPSDKRLPLAMALVCSRGSLDVDELSMCLRCSVEDAWALMETLSSWGSVVEDEYVDGLYLTVPRDGRGLTALDKGCDRTALEGARYGEPCLGGDVDPDVFYASELGRTYGGLGWLKRIAILLAGPLSNVLLAFIIFMIIGLGVQTAYFEPVVDEVVEGSYAQEAGILVGDRFVKIAGEDVETCEQAFNMLGKHRDGEPFTMVVERAGGDVEIQLVYDADTVLGIKSYVDYANRGFGEAFVLAGDLVVQTGAAVVNLLIPQKAAETISQSSGIVGIAATTSDAIDVGPWAVLFLLGAISVSLGWMNLLPVVPLDGGKIVVEVVQRVTGKELSVGALGVLTIIGVLLVVALFVVLLYNDVLALFF